MKPIIFNTEMTRAILEGRKTVTRRVARGAPFRDDLKPYEANRNIGLIASNGRVFILKPPYHTGDILYVKETYNVICGEYIYKAEIGRESKWPWTWFPSVHMPKEAARIFLRVTGVRVERLRDITENGAIEEGYQGSFPGDGSGIGNGGIITPIGEFSKLWDITIKPADRAMYGWEANPWVFVIEFERISKEEAEL